MEEGEEGKTGRDESAASVSFIFRRRYIFHNPRKLFLDPTHFSHGKKTLDLTVAAKFFPGVFNIDAVQGLPLKNCEIALLRGIQSW